MLFRIFNRSDNQFFRKIEETRRKDKLIKLYIKANKYKNTIMQVLKSTTILDLNKDCIEEITSYLKDKDKITFGTSCQELHKLLFPIINKINLGYLEKQVSKLESKNLSLEKDLNAKTNITFKTKKRSPRRNRKKSQKDSGKKRSRKRSRKSNGHRRKCSCRNC